MNFIKEQLNDFWQYFKMFGHAGANASKTRFRHFLYLLFVVIISFIFASVHLYSTANSTTINYTIAFLAGFAIGVGYQSNNRPTLLTVSPFSPKQRTVFNYLVSLVYTIIYTVFVVVIMILLILIMALVAFLVSGENIFTAGEIIEQNSYWHDLLCDFTGLYFFFSVYAVTHITKRKYRNIAITLWFVLNEVLMLVLVNVVNTASNGGVYPGFAFTTPLSTAIDNLAHPWVPALIAGLMTAVAFGLSIFSSYTCHRSRKF